MPFEPMFAERLSVFDDPTLDQWGALMAFMARVHDYTAPAARVEPISIPGPVDPIPARIYTSNTDAALRPGLLWFHGGAFVSGNLDMPEADQTAREICERADAVVLSSDYRLCTEDRRFPAPQQDGWAALRWFATHAEQLGVDPHRIFVGGGSAGACLAGSLALMDRDADAPALAGSLLIYPIVHALPQAKSEQLQACLTEMPWQIRFEDDWIETQNAWLLDAPDASSVPGFPGDSADHADLAPTLIVNCEYDSLRASGERYVEQLREAGVDVVARLEPGVTHGHLNSTPADCLGTENTLRAMADFIASHARA